MEGVQECPSILPLVLAMFDIPDMCSDHDLYSCTATLLWLSISDVGCNIKYRAYRDRLLKGTWVEVYKPRSGMGKRKQRT